MKKQLPPQELLDQLLTYNASTGKLYWNDRDVSMFSANSKWTQKQVYAAWHTRFAGKEAFTATNAAGYKTGYILGTSFLAHRVIWKLVRGVEPNEIDHRDHDPGNNRWSNLRDITPIQNRRHRVLSTRNTSGVSGVYFSRSEGLWVVEIAQKRIGRRKHFDDAVALREAEEVRLGYTR